MANSCPNRRNIIARCKIKVTSKVSSTVFHQEVSLMEIKDSLELFVKLANIKINTDFKLKRIANELGLDLFSSPFDSTAVDFLERMNVSVYKVASFEIVDIPLLRKIAQTGKPLIISSGMASHEEIEEALQTVRETGNNQIALLKCVSAYPASPEEMHLRTIPHMADTFNVPVGLSDHSLYGENELLDLLLNLNWSRHSRIILQFSFKRYIQNYVRK